jgi:hypothetical protein
MLSALATGCSLMAPNYNPSIENVQKLRDSGAGKARVGAFEPRLASGQSDESIQLRGAGMQSPYGKFSAYIQEAIKLEFSTAQLLDDKAQIEIGGVVMKNDVSVGGISEGFGEIEARVIVKRDGQVRYDKVNFARHTFETSFAGAVAIPAGQRAYPELVQKFLAVLYSDPEFIAALR